MAPLLLKLSTQDNVHRQDVHSLLWSYLEYQVNSPFVSFKLKASPFIKLMMLLVKERVLHFNKYRKTPIQPVLQESTSDIPEQMTCSLMAGHTVKPDNTGVRPFLPQQRKASTSPIESLSHDLLHQTPAIRSHAIAPG